MTDHDGQFKPGNQLGISGRWKPGQSGNPKGRPLSRPFKDALERSLALLAEKQGLPPELGHDVLAAALVAKAMNGDVAAWKEVADRTDGKVPTPIGGSDELPPITAFAWRPPDMPETAELTQQQQAGMAPITEATVETSE